MSDESVLEHASVMADALGDGTWKTWDQDQAHEVEEVLDSLRRMVRDREDHIEPGDPIASILCSCCGASLTIEHGDDPGAVSAIGAPSAEGADNIAAKYEDACKSK